MTRAANSRLGRFFGLAIGILLAVTGAGCAVAWKPVIAPIQPPMRDTFSASEIARGAELAALGDCAVCHTMPNGPALAGGRGVPTPFGTVYATNITPDAKTGIGHWPLPAFNRAMRDGVDREGRYLYPVLPYPHFIHATDADISAMYAFLMTRAAAALKPRRNALSFPFNVRPLLAGWDLLFLKPGEWRPNPTQKPEWNRGAYLVEAIGHCGACHTPHNLLGAEQAGRPFAGGEAEGWYAPPLGADSPAPQPWTADQLTSYLRTGIEQGHGAAAGPMTAVTQQLATVPREDVHAMAVYIASLMPPAAPAAGRPEPRNVPGPEASAIFDGACGSCHGADAPMTLSGAPPLSRATPVRESTARDVVNVILHGLPWREGYAGPYMPAFGDALTDQEVAALTAYVRARYSDLPAWSGIEATVRQARHQSGGT